MLLATTLGARGRQSYEMAARYNETNHRYNGINHRFQRTDSFQETPGFGRYIYLGLKKYLVCIVLISTIIYHSLLSKEIRTTNNWEHMRSIGIKATNYKVSSNAQYAAVDYENTWVHGEYNPIVVSTGGETYVPCFTDKVLNDCKDVLTEDRYQIPVDVMNNYFEIPNNRNYFPFSSMILILSFFSLAITVLFDVCDSKVGTEQGRFTTQFNENMLKNINIILILCIIAVSLASSGNYSTVFDEDCVAVYDNIITPSNIDDEKERTTFCRELSDCGASIASVVNPTSAIARIYPNISFAIGIIMIIALSFKVSEPRPARRPRVAVITRDDIDEILEVLEEGLNSRRERGHNADILILRNRTTNDGTIISSRLVTRMNDINDRNKIISSLKTISVSDPICSNVECSICLSQLNECKDDDVVSIKCGHLFHKRCILQWTCTGKVICPLCRAQIM